MTILPIDIILGTNPPKFRWTQTISLPVGGEVTQTCEGLLPPTVEQAVKALIELAKRVLMENAGLRGQIESMAERIAGQSELLGKSAERIAETPIPFPTKPPLGNKQRR